MTTRDVIDGELLALLDHHGRSIDDALGRLIDEWKPRIPGQIAEAISYAVLGGGKRLRPILCLAAYEACGGAGPEKLVAEAAASLELIHGYSLMHDDLPCMDDADLRRGRASTHRVHGERTTVRAGAVLIPLAVQTALTRARLLGCSESEARRVAGILARASGAGGMVGGQALDLLGEEKKLTVDELEELHRLKTGALLTASLEMGAALARASDRERRGLRRYGVAVGLAFQIADDVLDATASSAMLGKRPSDTSLGKTTYVSIHGLDRARDLAHREVAKARLALRESGVESDLLDEIAGYIVARES